MKSFYLKSVSTMISAMLCILALSVFSIDAQTNDFTAQRKEAIKLLNDSKFREALPMFEKLSNEKEADDQIFFGLGLCYWRIQEDPSVDFKQTRLKAKAAFLKAKELGLRNGDVDLLIGSIRNDGGDKNVPDGAEAKEAMAKGDESFMGGDYKNAVIHYAKAASLDPNHYVLALYTGNTFFALQDYDNAGKWFAKAIALDPNTETAHRYWGDAFLKNGNDKLALEKFFDAIIAEPYNSAAWRGISNYASFKKIQVSHPRINIPVSVTSEGQNKTTINLGALLSDDKDDDSGAAWMMYGISKAAWGLQEDGKPSEKFSKAYPNERVYRHSLAEELDAFDLVLSMLKTDNKKKKKFDKDLAALLKLKEEGLLPVYILLARSTAGVKQDYPAFRDVEKDKIKLYLTNYVLKNGGL